MHFVIMQLNGAKKRLCVRFRIAHIKSKVYECNRVNLFGSSMSVVFSFTLLLWIIVDMLRIGTSVWEYMIAVGV